MIELDDVFVLYRGEAHDVVALRGMNLRVGAGERVVVHGPSGSGKSTLVRVLTAEVAPSAGRATLLGREVASLVGGRASARRALVGVVTQGSGRDLAPELTCMQNVALQARLAGAERRVAERDAVDVLGRFGVGHLTSRLPATLSNGEAQRVAIACALASQPGVIIADEPTGELDRASADTVYRLLAEQAVASGACLLLVTHDRVAASIADRVVTIRDGRVSEEHAQGVDALLVDDRGWVRLPEEARRAAAITDRAIVVTTPSRGGAIVLAGTGPVVAPVAEPTRTVAVASPCFVRAKDVEFAVGGTRVLPPISLDVCVGLTVLVGPSGSGKTTLLGLLAGLGVPTSGSIERRPGASISVASSLAGFAEQLTLRENLALVRRVRGLPVDGEAAQMAELLDLLGVVHLGDRPVRALSGGERQRAGIARALCSGTDVALLDEPTSQLDEASARRVADVLARAAAERAIVCTTHDPAVTSRADTVITLG